MEPIRNFLNYDLIQLKSYTLTVADVCTALIIVLLGWLFMYVLNQYVFQLFFKRRKVTLRNQYAVNQLIKYIFYPITALLAMQALGIEMSVVMAGAAALMVGIGLGLQQTFKDLFSGIILLIEGTVRIDDMLVIGDSVVTVKEIGIRTSKVETRDDIVKIVPNTKLVEDVVVNWSHNNRPTRFHIDLGVAYGSDLALVKQLLLQSANEHPKVLDKPMASVQFREFGTSALSFKLLFYSYDFPGVDVTKSDIRFRIDELFRANAIKIPFPQQEVWLRNELVSQQIQPSNGLEKGHI